MTMDIKNFTNPDATKPWYAIGHGGQDYGKVLTIDVLNVEIFEIKEWDSKTSV